MQKKNKVMLAAAIGMVAVIIGSTAVRCSIAHTVEENAQNEAQAPVESIVQDAGGADAAETASATDTSEEMAKMLQGNVWQAEGAPEKTIEFRDRSFVESDGSSVKLTVFDVKEAGEGNGQKHLDIDFMREGDPYTTPASIIVEERDGALTVASDAFAVESRYVQGKPAGTAPTRASSTARRASSPRPSAPGAQRTPPPPPPPPSTARCTWTCAAGA